MKENEDHEARIAKLENDLAIQKELTSVLYELINNVDAMSKDSNRHKQSRYNALAAQVKSLEKRIELNTTERAIDGLTELLNDDVLFEITIKYQGTYKRYFEKEYSIERFREKGLTTDFDKFDFKTLLEKNKKLNTRLEKLHFWEECERDLNLELSFGKVAFWNRLHSFIKHAISYYRTSLVGYILDEGEYLDKGGRRRDYDKNEIIEHWNALTTDPDPEYIHETTRYKGKIKRGKVFEAIADLVGVPEHQENRTQTIATIIKEYEREL